jgi:hypothetical protein
MKASESTERRETVVAYSHLPFSGIYLRLSVGDSLLFRFSVTML